MCARTTSSRSVAASSFSSLYTSRSSDCSTVTASRPSPCSVSVSTSTAAARTSAAVSRLQQDRCCSTSPVIEPRLNRRFLQTSPEIHNFLREGLKKSM